MFIFVLSANQFLLEHKVRLLRLAFWEAVHLVSEMLLLATGGFSSARRRLIHDHGLLVPPFTSKPTLRAPPGHKKSDDKSTSTVTACCQEAEHLLVSMKQG